VNHVWRLALAWLLLALPGCAEPDAPGPGGRSGPRRHEPATPVPAEPGATVEKSNDNVVLVIIDTLRADKLGCYGFDLDTSPELDCLAEHGVRFERVISQCSWTRPSIGSMLTGLHPRTLGLYRGRDETLDRRFDTLAELLRESGYATIGIAANPQIAGRIGFDQGFDVYVDSPRDLPVRARPATVREQWRRAGASHLRSPFSSLPSAEVFDSALELAGRVSDAPVFLMINVMEVHEKGPAVRPEFAGKYAAHPDRRYLRAIRQISFDLGRFLDRLLALPGFEQTLVVIAADHGQGLRDHPGIKYGERHGYLLYESQVRVPLILFHTAGAIEPGVVPTPVRDMDIAPTVLDFLDLDVPAAFAGRSLLGLLDDPAADVGLPPRFVTETYRPDAAKIAVYAAAWKYIENRDDWPLLDEQELQAMGQREVGPFTDRIDLESEVASDLDQYLAGWERAHPKADPVYRDRGLSSDLRQRLSNLGYMDDAGPADQLPGAP